MEAATESSRIPKSIVERVAILLLLTVAVATWFHIYDFSQQRFFTVDEYQYGHATWLVSEGRIPYLDFYEHHFPLSYVMHSVLLPEDGTFSERALALRRIAFAYALTASIALAVAAMAVTGNLYLALLSGFLPAALGFGLMSAVDYRADNFAAFSWLVCLALLEANRVWRRRAIAALCGVGMAVGVLITQKMVFLVGGSIGLAIAWDLLQRRRASEADAPTPLVIHPWTVFAVAAGAVVLFVAWGGALGILSLAWEKTIVFGFQHEALYHEVPFSDFGDPFAAETRYSTFPILALFAASLAVKTNRFWIIPLIVTIAGGLLIRAQFPYNYVLLCYLIGVFSLRGYAESVEWVSGRFRSSALRALLYLVPLAVLTDQLDFVAHASTNGHQLAVLDKIERFTEPGDVVIDAAGGALFRDHASYYWYHGSAHRKLLKVYFEHNLVDDFRQSEALFWIRDFRTDELPKRVRHYLTSHYVGAGGDLRALGFFTRPTRAVAESTSIDVIRADDYYVYPVEAGSRPFSVQKGWRDPTGTVEIDGEEVRAGRVRLEVGRHRVVVPSESPGYLISPHPAEVFQDLRQYDLEHTPLFEYERAR